MIDLLNTDEDIRVAQNFTLPELVKSSTADRLGISNMPANAQILVNLCLLYTSPSPRD